MRDPTEPSLQPKLSPRPTLLSPPSSWTRRDGSGYVMHADAQCDDRLAFAFAVARGLEDQPRNIDCCFLYDDEGSRIFDRICETPEYYQTRTEDGILAASAADIRARTGDVTLVELGSGSSQKTRRLLDAFTAHGPARYIPIDISPGALEPACARLAAAYPTLTIEGVAASFDRGLPLVSAVSPVCLTFLGSSIGNFNRADTERFLDDLASALRPGDFFLVGLDLVKDAARLEASYDDAAGWSAAFAKNVFARANRELGTRIPLDAIDYVAFYNDRLERIEMSLRFRREVRIDLPLVERSYRIAAGEQVRTEISTKYRAEAFAAHAARFGFSLEADYRDPESLFGVLLLRRRRRAPIADERARIEAILRRVRVRTVEIISPLGDEDVRIQPSPLMSPLAWDLGHIAAFEELWLVKKLSPDFEVAGNAEADSDVGPEFGEGLDRTYDPLLHPRPERSRLRLPSRADALENLHAVRSAAVETLRKIDLRSSDPLVSGGFVHAMTAQHEAQHQETMLAAIQLRKDLVYAPPFVASPPVVAGHRPIGETILVPAGPFRMGSDAPHVAYDNERPTHEVDLAAYRIDAAPVTNGQFLAFIEDGGYTRPELWSDEGRKWLVDSAARAPGHWEDEDGTWMARIFGRLEPIDPDRPVIHVSWFEADAFARWSGRRLPTEAEWEKAAGWDPERLEMRVYPWGGAKPTVDHANLDQRLLEPAPVGAYPRGKSFYGCHQMLGDVWEWTASWFQPYPGFRAFPYRQYSEIFFGERYRVLRGGGWATLSWAIRCTFRNWDFPERRQIFAGFRCASDA